MKTAVPIQIKMLVRTPAGLPRSWRSSPMMPPQAAETPIAAQNAEVSGSKWVKFNLPRRLALPAGCEGELHQRGRIRALLHVLLGRADLAGNLGAIDALETDAREELRSALGPEVEVA